SGNSIDFADGKIAVDQGQLSEERYVQSTRWTLVMLLLGCAMTGASIFILLLFSASNRPEAAWGVMFGWFAVAFFGLGVCLSLALLARPQTLLLDSAGFTLAGGLIRRPLKTAWRDVERFFVYRQGFASPSHIGINFAANRAPNHWLLKYSRAVGLEGALPDGWALPTREMVARLNAYRERALASAGDPDELHVASESPASEPSNVEGENSVVFGPERCVTSARKVSFMLLLGCVFVAGSFFVTRAAGLFAIVFLAIPLLRLLWLLIRPYKLLLDGDGFKLSGGTSLKPQKTAWRDVERFFIRGSGVLGPQFVAWGCVAGRSPKKRAFMSQFFAPEGELADGELPNLWTLSAPELEQRLNAYRARALAAQDKLTK
ncbi:MAG: hypothetical protein ACXW3J_04120, partial [Methylocystis sp.]